MYILSVWKIPFSLHPCHQEVRVNLKKKDGYSMWQLPVRKNRQPSVMHLTGINGETLRDAAQAGSFGKLIRNFCFIPKPVENLFPSIINQQSNIIRFVSNHVLMQRMTGLKRSREQALQLMFLLQEAIPLCFLRVIM